MSSGVLATAPALLVSSVIMFFGCKVFPYLFFVGPRERRAQGKRDGGKEGPRERGTQGKRDAGKEGRRKLGRGKLRHRKLGSGKLGRGKLGRLSASYLNIVTQIQYTILHTLHNKPLSQ